MRKTIDEIALKDIIPDENQPRKYFDAERLNDLRSSIEKYGIRQPLVVEEMVGGKYLLVDGERRFRAATLLNLKTVPAIVNPAQDATARLIEQFQLQEQHEGWSAIEKAKAIEKLSKSMGISFRALCEALKMPSRTIGDYLAFGQLINQNAFEKHELSVNLAKKVYTLRNVVRKRYAKVTGKEMTPTTEKKFEHAIILGLSNGTIANAQELSKIRDSIETDINNIEKVIDGKKTARELFSESEARAAYFFRNVKNNALYVNSNIVGFMGAAGSTAILRDKQEEKALLKNTAKKMMQLADLIPDKE